MDLIEFNLIFKLFFIIVILTVSYFTFLLCFNYV